MEHSPKTHKVHLSCKDHSVTGESFQLLYDDAYDMLVTFPKPSEEDLGSYYETEDYISHTDGKRNLLEKTYQWVKRISLKQKRKTMNSYFPNKGKVLDIGAGTGDFLAFMKRGGWSVFGAEPNSRAATLAKAKGIDLDEDTSEFEDNTFDVITMWHVLEHVYDPKHQIEELRRLVAEGGKILVGVPNYRSHDAEIYKEFWAAYDVPRHLYHFSKRSLILLFGEAGFQLDEILPMKFDAFYVSLLSEKYRSGNIDHVAAFLNGLKSNLKARATGEYSSLTYVFSPQRPNKAV